MPKMTPEQIEEQKKKAKKYSPEDSKNPIIFANLLAKIMINDMPPCMEKYGLTYEHIEVQTMDLAGLVDLVLDNKIARNKVKDAICFLLEERRQTLTNILIKFGIDADQASDYTLIVRPNNFSSDRELEYILKLKGSVQQK